MQFSKVNLNPKGRKTADCVIRAIAYTTKQSWEKVYTDLSELALSQYRMPNEKAVYSKYLETIGWVKKPMPRFEDNTRYTVKEFIEANPMGLYVIGVANHLTVADRGYLVDIWNCGGKSVGNYWVKG